MRKYVYFVRGNKHRDMAIISAQSVAERDPTAARIIITDDSTDLTPCRAQFTQISFAMFDKPLRLMTANVAVIADMVLGAEPTDELWFIDPDTLLQKPLVMPPKCDIAATWRVVLLDVDREAVADMPYNFGVIGFRGTPAARDAAVWMRERVASFNPGYQDWYGNQMALAALAGPIPSNGVDPIVRRGIPWRPFDEPTTSVNIARLPCDEWNYTPITGDEICDDKRLLHFKGVRRKFMPAYARQRGFTMEDFPNDPQQ